MAYKRLAWGTRSLELQFLLPLYFFFFSVSSFFCLSSRTSCLDLTAQINQVACHKEQNKQMERKMQLHIPNDIVIEILLRIPAKSLLRLRWACKYLFDLITRDDDFINMHFHRSNHDDEFFSPIVLSSHYRYGDLQQKNQCHLNFSNATSYISREASVVVPYEYLKTPSDILGSCNGLILLCMWEVEKLCIWNPCTKEYIILPLPFSGTGRMVNYGFGYADDYKVILINTYSSDSDDVQVYTLGTNSWRKIGYNPYRLQTLARDLLKGGVFMNGVLYWMDFVCENIISFDIKKEKFQLVSKLPNVTDNVVISWYYTRLQVFEGSLCVVLKIKEQENNRAEIWVMRDYSANNNKKKNAFLWSNLLTIPNLADVMFPIKVLRYARNGEILMLNSCREFKLYDPKSSKDRTLCRLSDVVPNLYEIEVYTESLVCMNSGTCMGQEQKKNNDD